LIDKLKRRQRDAELGLKGLRGYRAEVSRLTILARCLGKFGPDAKEAVQPLQGLLQFGHVYLEMEIASALWQIERSELALGYLKQNLTGDSPEVRLRAVAILHDLGKLPNEAARVVAELVRHEDFEIRDKAATLLKRIDPETAKKLRIE
jgi:HEAT repeat protein